MLQKPKIHEYLDLFISSILAIFLYILFTWLRNIKIINNVQFT